MARVQKGMNVNYLGRLGKILVIDEQEKFALFESYNSHKQYAVPLEQLEEIEAQLPLSIRIESLLKPGVISNRIKKRANRLFFII
ncbi:hypothetical protein A165_09570 [Vibrio tasmaniensis ZS-17]|nr:hypothetical protein A165_09570 [Vibrio tasmaniensis ZS-17]